MPRTRALRLPLIAFVSLTLLIGVRTGSAVDLAKPSATDDISSRPLSPEESLNAITLRPGLEIELVAAEPLVVDPVAFAWGADGRFWVVEMRDYPLGLDGKGTPGGRVKILDDDDGDGRYDRATIFLDGLAYPTSVLPWRNGALICSVPEIIFAADTDGDGRADKRETLYKGLTVGNPQHLANGLRLGLDGWVHCANGATNTSIESVQTKEKLAIGTRDFRIHPDSGRVEPLAGRSQCLREMDDWGNWFGSTNSNPLYHFTLEERYLKRNPFASYPSPQRDVSVTPGASECFPTSKTVIRFNQPDRANRFTSACSANFYRDDFLGSEYRGNSFVCEPVHNLIHREIVEPQGVSFTSRRAKDEERSEFLSSRDNWFRPTMVRTGPDGALWIADMYRLVIEHPEWISKEWQAKLDLRAGSDKGRIYRVFPRGLKPWSPTKLARLKEAELVEKFESPNGTVRDMAQQLLVERYGNLKQRTFESGNAVDALVKLVQTSSRPTARLHALATLSLLGDELDTLVLRKALADEHPGVRRLALSLVTNEDVLLDDKLFGAMLASVGDSEVLRLQLTNSLGDLEPTNAGAAWLARMVCDEGLLGAAAKSSLHKLNIADVCRALAQGKVENPAAPIRNCIDVAAALEDTIALKHLMTLTAHETPAERHLAVIAVLQGLARQQITLSRLHHLLSLRGTVDEFRGRVAEMRATVVDDKAPLPVRVGALRVFGYDEPQRAEELAAIRRLIVPQSPDELQAAAIAAAEKYAGGEVPEMLIATWGTLSPARKSQVLDVLLARPTSTEALIAAIAAKKIAPSEIDAVRTQTLLNLKQPALRMQAEQALASSIDADRKRVIDAYQPALSLTGDAARGREVFVKSCATCHKLGDVGNVIGPDLMALTDKSPAATLISVLDPNRAVESKYKAYSAETVAGLSYVGVLVGETSNDITLALADGKRVTVRRGELESFQASAKSFMPEGMEKDISPQKFADLLAFLAERYKSK